MDVLKKGKGYILTNYKASKPFTNFLGQQRQKVACINDVLTCKVHHRLNGLDRQGYTAGFPPLAICVSLDIGSVTSPAFVHVSGPHLLQSCRCPLFVALDVVQSVFMPFPSLFCPVNTGMGLPALKFPAPVLELDVEWCCRGHGVWVVMGCCESLLCYFT